MTPTLTRGLAPLRAVLSNGAVVIAQETVMTPAVTMSAVFHAGSIYEPADLQGLASLTGRVMDRGTERREGAEIAQELDDRGVSLKVSTNRHAVTLTTTCLTEDFADILDIVLDVARRAVFPEEEVAKRRGEALTAVRQDDDNPAVRAVQALLGLIYGESHPYGHSVKGTLESLERITRNDIVRFHAERVRPSTLSLAIVGDVRPERAIDQSRKLLEDWRGEPAGVVDLPRSNNRPERRIQSISMQGKAQSDIAYGFATIPRLDPRFYAYWMMNNILGQFGLGGRLADNIRERQGMAYYAYSSFDPSHVSAPLIIRAGVDPRQCRSCDCGHRSGSGCARSRRANRGRDARVARLPGRLHPAAPRNESEHRHVPAAGGRVPSRPRLRSAVARASARSHPRRCASCGT